MRDHRKLRAFELADALAVAVYQISLAHRLEYSAEDAHASLASACEETCKVLNGLIRACVTESPVPPASSLQPPEP